MKSVISGIRNIIGSDGVFNIYFEYTKVIFFIYKEEIPIEYTSGGVLSLGNNNNNSVTYTYELIQELLKIFDLIKSNRVDIETTMGWR